MIIYLITHLRALKRVWGAVDKYMLIKDLNYF